MISREEFVRLAKARGLAPWQEEKRYVQALVLHALREEGVAMKGGTYLWFFHGLDRFSEDLDYAALGRVDKGMIQRCTDTLGVFGVDAGTKLVKDDRFTLTFRVDARGPLYSGEKSICRVLVEISRREALLRKPAVGRLDEAGYLLPIDLMRGMALEEVAAEKTRALLRRGEARDAYDLWFLLNRKGVSPEMGLVGKKLEFYRQGFTVERLERALEGVARGWSGTLRPMVFGVLPPFADVRRDLVGVFTNVRANG